MAIGPPCTVSSRSFKATEYTQQLLRNRAERHVLLYSVVFLPEATDGSTSQIVAATSNGSIRVYDVKGIMTQWLSHQSPGWHSYEWTAHVGPVYQLTLYSSGDSHFLVSCGDDGFVRLWSVAAIEAWCSGGQQDRPGLAFEAKVPHNTSAFATMYPHPAVLSMAVDPTGGRLFAGTSDGACHMFDLADGAGTSPSTSLVGHLAPLQALDFCPAVNCLASASDDATVRVWDVRAGGGHPDGGCVHTIDPWNGVRLEGGRRSALLGAAAGGSALTAVQFDASGSWLVCGTANSSLTLWSMTLGSLAKQQSTPAVPQVLRISGGEILVAGAAPSLYRYRFSLDAPVAHALSPQSVMGLDVHPTSHIMALCGVHGCLDLLSTYGTCLGSVFCPSEEE